MEERLFVMSLSFKVQCFSIWPMDPLWLTYYLGEYHTDTDSLNLGNNARGVQCGLANILFFFLNLSIKCILYSHWKWIEELENHYEGEERVLHLPAPVPRLRFWSFPFLLVFTFLRTRPCTALQAAGLDGIVGPYKGLGGVHFGLWCKNGTLPAGPIQAFKIDISADSNY